MSNDHRYTRQMIMPQIGREGQMLLSSSKVLIVGAGGIGSTVAMYMAASGVHTDVLDFDLVEVSNLHRYAFVSLDL
jgi:sulfur-carrier protein adenylyltransferase/sulfurtransferase